MSSYSNSVCSRHSCRLITDIYETALAGCPSAGGLPKISFNTRKEVRSKLGDFLAVPTDITRPASSYASSLTSAASSQESALEDDFDASYHNFSKTSHMCILDPKYTVFVSRFGHGSLVYRMHNNVAVVAGDPLCDPAQTNALFDEFRLFNGNKRMKIIHYAASAAFSEYAQTQGCVVMNFARERILNPVTNNLCESKSGKRIASQCRKLLDPKREGIQVGIYAPGLSEHDPTLEEEMQTVYDSWRTKRDSEENASSAQTFITQYDLFARPEITIYLYTWGPDGRINGVAGLRCLGANDGFQLDPCIASEDAPRGITDLLVVISTQLLKRSGITYLSLGVEPFESLRELSGQTGLWAHLTKKSYRRLMTTVAVDGKRSYYDKFRPDDEQAGNLYIILPKGTFHIREMMALMQIANISLGRLFT